jgi:hypothetical protein
MSALLNLVGQRFGRLRVVARGENSTSGQTCWLCQCDCGQFTTVSSTHLRIGNTKSCGCLALEMRTKHSHAARGLRDRTYESWEAMKQRCTNPNQPRWECYGGAGVTVCERWMTFTNFLADMGERPEGTTLGRFGDVGNYEPGNCAWQTQREQTETAVYKRAAMEMEAA